MEVLPLQSFLGLFTNPDPEYSEPVTGTDRADDEMGRSNQSSEYEYSRTCPTVSDAMKGTKRSASEEDLSKSKAMQSVTENLRRNDDSKIDRNEIFGKYVADELNNMPLEMVPHVKKIINLAIFEGNMKTLNATSAIKTCPNRHAASGETSSSTEDR
ncbi:uncharacterized protein [Halyomorpha halys]|uniref:uncharacterized protein isoform X2 n=1 Tax=Halyomorpha halys TaxID=286706 RepID=UPI0006D4EADB|nr:uncharacterized protein LOC106687590 isoform X2 [Halyomorpha halys]